MTRTVNHVTRNLSGLTRSIRSCMRQITRNVIQIGLHLQAAKDLLPHGQFLPWIEGEFSMSEASAHRFMRVAARFAETPLAEFAIEPSALYLLAAPSTPQAAIEAAFEAARQGIVLTPQVARTLRDTHRQAPPVSQAPALPALPDLDDDDLEAAPSPAPHFFEDVPLEEFDPLHPSGRPMIGDPVATAGVFKPPAEEPPPIRYLVLQVDPSHQDPRGLTAHISRLPGVWEVYPLATWDDVLRLTPRTDTPEGVV